MRMTTRLFPKTPLLWSRESQYLVAVLVCLPAFRAVQLQLRQETGEPHRKFVPGLCLADGVTPEIHPTRKLTYLTGGCVYSLFAVVRTSQSKALSFP